MAGEVIQTLGRNGYVNEFPVGRLWRHAKLYEIGAGSSDIRRMLIGRELFAKSAAQRRLDSDTKTRSHASISRQSSQMLNNAREVDGAVAGYLKLIIDVFGMPAERRKNAGSACGVLG